MPHPPACTLRREAADEQQDSINQGLIEKLRGRYCTSKNPDLFRCIAVSYILQGFGRVFASGVSNIAAKKVDAKTESIHPAGAEVDVDHSSTDETFYGLASATTSVDYFISHVWSAPRWQKHLAMLYFINIRVALLGSVLVWFIAEVGFVGYIIAAKGSLEKNPFGGSQAVVYLVLYVPMATFFLLIFCGHHVGAGHGAKFWLDKFCIHQSRKEIMREGVSALPEFVCHSNRMLILWDEKYFERLWCNMEVATFCAMKERTATTSVDLQPLWLAPWVLVTLVLDIVSSIILAQIMQVVPQELGMLLAPSVSLTVSYMPAVIPNYVSFTTKIDNHCMMLEQLETYKLEHAKCTVESDRPIVEEQVQELFAASEELGFDRNNPHALPVERFNHFMNSTFRDAIVDRVGLVTALPYRISCLVFLPLIYYSGAVWIYCDGVACSDSAASQGYSSVTQYMLTVFFLGHVGNFLIFPTTYPVMLMGMSKIRSGCSCGFLSMAVCLGWIAMTYFYMSLLFGVCCILLPPAVQSGGYSIVIFGIFFLALIAWNVMLFGLPDSVTSILSFNRQPNWPAELTERLRST